MITSKDKISPRQAILLFVLGVMSPAIRLFPQSAARAAGKAGWLSPVAALVPMLILVFIVAAFFKNNKEESLSDVFYRILGKWVGKVVVVLYFIWVLCLAGLYIRYYSERLQTSMMPGTSAEFLIFIMMLIVYFGIRQGLVVLARANEIFFKLFLLIFFVTVLLTLPQIRYYNLMMVSYKDAWPAAKGSVDIFGVWGYFLFLFFGADKINNKDKLKSAGLYGLGIIFVFATIVLIMTIGSLGATLASNVSLPFFITVKSISVLEVIDHIESLLIAIWVVSDFVLISLLIYVSSAMIKSLFNLQSTKPLTGPLILIAAVSALYFFDSRFELESFSIQFARYGNLLFEFMIPIVIFIVGKIRKKC